MGDAQISNYSKPNGPRVIKKHKESDYVNPSSNWFKITTAFACFSCYPAWDLINHTYPLNTQIALAVWSLTGVRYWWKYCGLYPRRADKSWTDFWFRIDKKIGCHKYNKHTTSDLTLSRLYLVKSIHDGGIIEYFNGHFCVLIDLSPKRLNDEERVLHRMFMKGLVDGLHDNQIFKMVATSRRNPRKQIIDFLIKVANKAGSKERARHLNSIIQKILQDQTPAIMYRHYGMIGLGQHETLEQARIAKESLVEGVMVNMKRAELRPALIENKRQIEKIYRESVSERVMF